MVLKITDIFVKPHIKRYIEATYQTNKGTIKIKSHITLATINNTIAVKDYINKSNRQSSVKVEMYNATPYRRYALMRFFTQLFNMNFYAYVSSEVRRDVPAMRAIATFLEKYNITEEEYAMDAAYKKWQRYKDNNPLC